jgi:hypothetical protein
MRTNVTLDEALVSELLALTREKTKTAAVTHAIREQIRRAKLAKLASLLGSIDVDEAALEAGERAEQERARLLAGAGGGHGR